jgi:hypothetical protein
VIRLVVIVQAGVQRVLFVALQETGDLRVGHLVSSLFSDLIDGCVRLPQQINPTVQVRAFADASLLRVAIVLQSPLDHALI